MRNKTWAAAMVVAASAILISFQNCGKLAASKEGAHSHSSHATPHIMRTSSVEAINTDIAFRVHDESLSASAQFQWAYLLDNVASGCTPKAASNASTFVLNCSRSGGLKVTVAVSDAGETQSLTYSTLLTGASSSGEIPMEVVFEIPAGTNNSAWNTAASRVETFVGQTLKLRNLDSSVHQLHTNGRPCPHGNEINPGATGDCVISQAFDRTTNGAVYDHIDGTRAEFHMVAYSGTALYAQVCQSCHGPLATSAVKNKKVSQILAARSAVAAMRVPAVQNLTQRQIEAISYALGGR